MRLAVLWHSTRRSFVSSALTVAKVSDVKLYLLKFGCGVGRWDLRVCFTYHGHWVVLQQRAADNHNWDACTCSQTCPNVLIMLHKQYSVTYTKHTHVHKHTYTHTHMHTQTHTHTHTCTHPHTAIHLITNSHMSTYTINEAVALWNNYVCVCVSVCAYY